MSNIYKVEVFNSKEELNEFLVKNEDIKIIRVEKNEDKRALFYEKEIKLDEKWKKYYENWEEMRENDDYGYSVCGRSEGGLGRDHYQGWNKKMWEEKFPHLFNREDLPFDY